MNPQWSFEQDGNARWRWKHVDEHNGQMESAESFATQVDCMLDAVRAAIRRRRGALGMGDDDQFQ